LSSLSRLVLQPIAPWLRRHAGIQSLRIATDGMLALIPFCALSDGHFLIERFSISYVGAGRDLVATASTAAKSAYAPRSGAVIASSPGGRAPVESQRSNPLAAQSIILERLQSAEQEVRGLTRLIAGVRVLGEGQATEAKIKQLHGPALLHFVGHGVVRLDVDCPSTNSGPDCQLKSLPAEARAMSLSAIVLEEAYGRGGSSTEDGFLTALELQNLDLHGTYMLVLTQCRMADGIPTSGDGVHGMRRAAVGAGAQSLAAPLWPVADRAEETLMTNFYRKLAAGVGRAEALRQAQLALMKSSTTSSFLYWAPMILAGDDGPLPKDLFIR
jgi:CHAT domain-containing protein